jgi:hypothetical protein
LYSNQSISATSLNLKGEEQWKVIFLTEKQDTQVRARMYTNGSTQQNYVDCYEALSPTAITESHIITSVIDAKQVRDVITANNPNAFVQTDADKK